MRPEEFPADFVWGAATAAYQVEGAVAEGGRTPRSGTPSPHTPGRVRDGDTGEVACDHYHRYADDVAPDARTSGWAPTGSRSRGRGASRRPAVGSTREGAGVLRPAGRRAARPRASTPWVTLYHWDLPQYARGRRRLAGPRHRRPAGRARRGRAAALLGDRVGHFITLNEPWCSAFLGYASRHPRARPARARPPRSRPATTCCSATGSPTQALRAAAPGAQVGTTLNLYPVVAGRRRAGGRRRWRAGSTGCTTAGSSTRSCAVRYPEDVVADLGPLLPGAGPRR